MKTRRDEVRRRRRCHCQKRCFSQEALLSQEIEKRRCRVQVEIWSDVVCPWCYVGKRRFEAALAGFEHRDDVEVIYRSFELDPGAPNVREGDSVERLAAKYGMTVAQADAANRNLTEVAAGEGLDVHLATTRSGNSFDAHRLIHLGASERPDADMEERLFAAYFTANEAIGDRDTLARIAVDAGLDAARVAEVLDGDEFAAAVRAEEAEARRLGANGVPFYVIDRTYGISGAQPVETFSAALAQAWVEPEPGARSEAASAGEGDSCAV
jgi:predicted DsbA family dithiol-disulfide isomerase